MNQLKSELKDHLESLRKQGLYRELRRIDSAQSAHVIVNGRPLLNFSSNDYLGLANDPVLKEAAITAIERYGAGAGASRLVCGSMGPHHQLDEAIAEFKGTEAALSFSAGYAASLGTITALLGKEDIIIMDKLVHASIVDAAMLCGAKLRVFRHNDLNDLDDRLQWATRRLPHKSRILVVTESVFSMDGDHAQLQAIVELKNKYGAWLMVDEAHATGLYGTNRRGLAEELGVGNQIEIQMGTLGKAFGASGGYICGALELIDYLLNRARSFIFSTAAVPAAAAAASAGVRFVQSSAGEERRQRLWERVADFGSLINNKSSRPRGGPQTLGDNPQSAAESSLSASQSAIMPLLIGDENKAVETAGALREAGILIPAIRYPTVARGTARLRLTMTAAHTRTDVKQLVEKLQTLPCEFQMPNFRFSSHAPVG